MADPGTIDPEIVGSGHSIIPRTPIAIGLGVMMALGLLVRLYHLGENSVWLDEAYSYWMSDQSWGDIWRIIASYDCHPPMYYSLLKMWRGADDSEFVMRSLSAVAGAATIPFVYLLARQVTEKRDGIFIGFLAAGLFTISPLHVEFAQQARPYALLTLAITVTLFGGAWLVVRPEAMRRPFLDIGLLIAEVRGRKRISSSFGAWISVIIGLSSALWLHNTSMIIFASLGLVGILIIFSGEFSTALFLNFSFVVAATILIWSPFGVLFVNQLSHVSNDYWIPELTWARGLAPMATVIDIHSVKPFTLSPVLAILALSGCQVICRSGRFHLALLLLGVAGFSYAFLVLFSLLVQPVVVERVFVWMNVPCLILVGAGLAHLEHPLIRRISILTVCGVSIFGTWNYHNTPSKEPWREVAAFLSEEMGERDVILTIPNFLTIPLTYYLDRSGAEVETVGLPESFPASRLDEGGWLDVNPKVEASDLPTIQSYADSPGGVWVVERLGPLFDPEDMVLGTLRNVREEHSAISVNNYISIYHFE